ncbi:MAG: putative DNA binding domain-containing protein, partial [Treponema sp.]|nr:putative DNA binding domain-containing protein [Treponema sp.]
MAKTETNRIEFKEKLTDDFEKEAVGFLNSEGGDIYIGIRKDGSVVGVPNPDEIQRKIADRLKDNIRPSIMGLFVILTETRDEKAVVIVNFASGAEKPYCVKQKGFSEAGCFVRVGSATQPMTQPLIDKMLAKRHHLSIANMPSRHQDLEFTQLKLYYGLKNKPLGNNFARTLDFLTPDGKYNLVAFLFADNNNISVRLGKYSGKNKMDLIEREDYKDCSLITAMQKIIDRLDIENITQSRKRPMRSRLDKNLIDRDVLHEVIINAFAHNDYSRLDTPMFQIYSDRFEVTSYGGLVGGLTLEEFYEGTSMPRNREVMRIFKDLEFVEQLGSGIPKIVGRYGRKVISVGENIVRTALKFDTDMGKKHPPKTPPNHKHTHNTKTTPTPTTPTTPPPNHPPHTPNHP